MPVEVLLEVPLETVVLLGTEVLLEEVLLEEVLLEEVELLTVALLASSPTKTALGVWML